MLSPAERRAKIRAVIRVASCNFIEAYDFIVYGYYANYIAATFFPAANEFASLMLSLVTFGAGYLMRPLGAIVLGSYMDRKGRKKGLILTLGLMAVGTLSIAVTPGYAQIGLLAPLLIVAGRLLQGLSAGAEFGGVAIYLSEIATPGRRGFYCSWQAVSQQVAVVFAALFGFGLTPIVPPEQMTLWGWRIAASGRHRRHPAHSLAEKIARGNRGFQAQPACAHDGRGAAHSRRPLEACGQWRRAHRDDDDELLSHHRLYADLCAPGAAHGAERGFPGHAAGRPLQPRLAAGRRRVDRSLRGAAADAARHHGGARHRLSGDGLAGATIRASPSFSPFCCSIRSISGFTTAR